MDTPKDISSKKSTLLAGIIILVCAIAAHTQELHWTSLTSFEDVRRIHLTNDTMYMATGGGLLILGVNDTNVPGLELTNADGLGTIDITDIITDSAGQKWITGHGHLLKFDFDSVEPFLFFDQNNTLLKLHTCTDDGSSLWVGTEIGLVLFSKIIDGGQIQDSYQLFGNLNPSPDVLDIHLKGDTIWLATSSGLVAADKSDPVQLKAPSFWNTYDRGNFPELASDTITRVVEFENSIYIGTLRGMYRLDRTTIDTFEVIPFGQTDEFTDLKIENDTLFFYSESAMGYIKDSVAVQLPTTGLPLVPATGVNTGSFRWVSLRNVAIMENSSGNYIEYSFTGLPYRVVTDLTVNAEGILTAGFSDRGAGRFENGEWVAFGLGRSSTVLAEGPSGNAWIGTFGNGLWLNGDTIMFNYDETNSTLRGNNDFPLGPRFVVINDLVTQGNFLYVSCFRALNIYPVAIGDLNNLNSLSGWDSLGLAQGISDEFVTGLDVHDSSLAVSTVGKGIFMCDLGPDPSNTSDDVCQLMNENNSFLISDAVRDVMFSPIGELWAATNFGISRYDLGIERFVDVTLPAGFGPDIKVLEFDTRGNLWAGSSNGVARIDALTGAGEYFSTLNSDLVSERINSIHYDRHTGDVYIATDDGISVVSSTIGEPTADLLTVVAFPNPFIIDSPDDQLEFNYSQSGVVSLYSMAGELIRELRIGRRWDGRNDKGEDVVSGVYLFVLADDEGNLGRGKILLIRR